MRHSVLGLLGVTLMLVTSACAVVQVEPQGRVASDQLLVSLATEDTVRALQLRDAVYGKAVRLTVTSIGTVDQDLSYVTEALRARVLQEGGRVVSDDSEAIELVAMIQTMGSDVDHSSVALPILIPALGSVTASELAFYSNSKQIARCRMWVYAVDSNGMLTFTHPPIHTAHNVRNPKLLGITLGKYSDVDELDLSKGRIPISNAGMTQ